MSYFIEAHLLYDEMLEKISVTFKTTITSYSMLHDVESTRLIFNEMPVKEFASYSAMISGYLSNGSWDKGLTLFREMMVNDEMLKLDQVTLVSILLGCTRMGSLGLLLGKSIPYFIENNEWELSVELGTVLVDMYTKCGFLKSVSRVFENMERNVMSWCVMICGLASHGYGEDVLSIFEKMKEVGVKPNEITFTCILSTCTHTRLIDKLKKFFEKMVQSIKLNQDFNIIGVWLIWWGKDGGLEEAYEVIKSMKLEPNIVVWSSLLATCKVHKRFKMAEKVIERVLMLAKSDTDDGVYTLVSDMYALNRKLEKSQWVRDLWLIKKLRRLEELDLLELEQLR